MIQLILGFIKFAGKTKLVFKDAYLLDDNNITNKNNKVVTIKICVSVRFPSEK